MALTDHLTRLFLTPDQAQQFVTYLDPQTLPAATISFSRGSPPGTVFH
jgi:hypothetical protein